MGGEGGAEVLKKAEAEAGAEINYSRGCQSLPEDCCMEPGVTNCFHNPGPCESDLYTDPFSESVRGEGALVFFNEDS